MSVPTDSEITAIHNAYKALTGMDVPYTMQLRFMFEAWLAAGFSEPDLACVVRYLKCRIKEGKNPKESLLPRNLIQRTDHFGENLAIARATARNERVQTPRGSVLRATGRPEHTETTSKAVGAILSNPDAAAKALQDLRQWRLENGI